MNDGEVVVIDDDDDDRDTDTDHVSVAVEEGFEGGMSVSARLEPTSTAAQQQNNKEAQGDKEQEDATESQSEQTCPICLDVLHDRALLDGCFHPFCFECIMEWLNVSRTCPLCKSPATSVVHSIKSDTMFERLNLPPKRPTTPPPAPSSHRPHWQRQPHARRHPYSQHHRRFGQAAHSSSSSSYYGGRGGRGAGGIRQRRGHAAERWVRWTSAETLSEEQRRKASLDRRRSVYACRMRALPEYDPTIKARERGIGPSQLLRTEANHRRVLAWARRDIEALIPSNAQFVFAYVESLLNATDLRQTQHMVHALAPFLLTHTELFVHELQMFVCLFVCLSVCLFVCLFLCFFVCLCVRVCVGSCMCACLSTCVCLGLLQAVIRHAVRAKHALLC